MTDINTTVGTIEHVDPAQVIVEANVRSTAPLDKNFLASIRENGVITPILARRDEQGNIIVRAVSAGPLQHAKSGFRQSRHMWWMLTRRSRIASCSRSSRTTTANR